jgi:subtilase family serine protease
MRMKRLATCIGALACVFTLNLASHAAAAGSKTARPLITQKIDETKVVALEKNVAHLNRAAEDLGPVESSFKFNHMFMVLKRTPESEMALQILLQHQVQKGAPEYHKWLTPTQFGATYGASQKDIATVTAWLQSKGFTVNHVPHSGMLIDFAGDAGTISKAFHTQLHYFSVDGERRVGNIGNPSIPQALLPAVAGIQGLNNFKPHADHSAPLGGRFSNASHKWDIISGTNPKPEWAIDAEDNWETPQDLYTIYNVNPLLTAGTNGTGANVAVIEEVDIEYGTVNPDTGQATGGDVATFRSIFGVPGTLSMYVYHGFGPDTCNDPGVPDTGEDIEASLDAEWANAVAPSSNLIFMSCDDTVDDGIFTSLQALVDNSLGDSMSLSYGESELDADSATISFLNTEYAQAAAQGQSVFISSGDSGSDVADQNTSGTATSGINVSVFAASPMVTSSGGTDFQDLYDNLENGTPLTNYWNTTNTSSWSNAISYVPEMSWNDSCGSSILAEFENGSDPATYCGTEPAFLNGYVVAGSGGFSTIYSVPNYQSGTPGYSGTMRAQPDISLLASNGFWGHAIVFCDSNPAYSGDGYACAVNSGALTAGGAGGTSFVAPQLNGVAGLLESANGVRQGLLNYSLYALAKVQYNDPILGTACYANGQTNNIGTTTGLPNSACTFNDVTTSTNDVPCEAGSLDCYVNSGAPYGILSTGGAGSLGIAYASTPDYDEVTGLGSINIANLVTNWKNALATSTTLTITPASTTATGSFSVSSTVTATGTTIPPQPPTGTVSYFATGTNGTATVATCTIASGACSTTFLASALDGGVLGSYLIMASYSGDSNYPPSVSNFQTVDVSDTTTTTVTASPIAIGASGTSTLTATVTDSITSTDVPTGTVTFSIGSDSLGNCTLASGSCTFSVQASSLTLGANTVTAMYDPSSPDWSTSTGTATVTLVSAPTLIATPTTVTVTAPGDSGTTVLTAAGFTGTTYTYSCSGLPRGAACSFQQMAPGSPIATMTITTKGKGSMTSSLTNGPHSSRLMFAFVAPGLLAIVGIFTTRRRHAQWTKMFVALLVLSTALTLNACSGSGNTPAGTSAVTVTATSGSQTASATVQLTVQ